MKKLVIGMFALCLGLGMVSCGNKAGGADGKDSTATAVEKKKVDPQEVLNKAKAEGANWDEAQWKANQKEMMSCVAPMMKSMQELQKKMEGASNGSDEEKAAALASGLQELQAKQKEYEPLEKIMEEYNKIVEANPIAKKISEDKAFEEELKKEFDLPEDM
jgi:hypothetical protein